MTDSSIQPKGENLRKAIQWISDHGKHDPKSIELACIQFDLTPQEESFLLRHFESPASDNR